MKLTIKQTRALDILEDKKHNTLLFGGGAGGGKSALGCYWILKNCFKYPNTRWLIGRSKLHTLKSTTLNTLFEIMKMQGITANDYYFNRTSGFMTFHSTNSQIVLKDLFYYPSDPNFDKLGSMEITGAFVDEASECTQKAIMILSSRIRFQLDVHNLVPKVLLTCNPTKNWLYNEFYKPWKDGTILRHRYFLQSLVTDNPYISKHYVGQLQRLDNVSRQRLLEGMWEYDDTLGKLFEYDKINDIFSNTFIPTGDLHISVDVARYGNDRSVVCLWNGFRCESILQYNKTSITELATHVIELAKRNKVSRSDIIVDEDGVGGGLVDILRCKGFVNNSRPIGKDNYANLKAQCYYMFADKVNKGEVYVNANMEERDSLAQELEVIQVRKLDSEQKLNVMEKSKIKDLIGRSPDIADALMMRMYFELSKSKVVYFG